ncbi:MAG: potassium channel protein [Ferruginibacter sp.]|uniref:potassium channel family protein n=1 Tax=Ferruginibacter sp. TaxID=1940288 RepID=UPI0026593337|nr:potassium channel protein [Ferruginibacter sp.]MDB5280099.1 potassium channel protein [Ferruginibacter sp.]
MYLLKRLHLFKGLFFALLLLGGLMLIGTVGYMLIEKYSFLEALYMTVITVASVGFNEVKPLTNPGRVFTILLILINLGLFTYFITWLSRYFSDLELVKQFKRINMDNKIDHLNNHVIICGFGRNGKESAQILFNNKIPFVIVEEKKEPDTTLGFEVKHYLKGDATKDEILIEAGINKARALITTLPVDADNLFVVLSAKQLNPSVTIISRASQDSSVNKLKIAGASNVIMPDKIGGAHMATLIMMPDVMELLSMMSTKNNTQFRVAELKATKNISLNELDLWKKTNCTILGIKEENNYTMNPSAAFQLHTGLSIIVMGSDEQIEQAKNMI